MNRRGAEVTHYQGLVDWNILSPLIDVAYFKVSDGLGIDNLYLENSSKCPGYLEKRYYHFYRSNLSAKEQVQHFIKASGAVKGSMMAVDVEKLSKPTVKTAGEIYEFCGRVYDAGFEAMIYSNVDVIVNYLAKEIRLAQFRLWLAHWGVVVPKVPLPWFPDCWDTWQFAVVPGKDWGTQITNGKYPKIDLDVIHY